MQGERDNSRTGSLIMKLQSLTLCFVSSALVFATAAAVEVGDVAAYSDGLFTSTLAAANFSRVMSSFT